ncbi:MAG: hypothetical protein EP335_05095 [Alphaproteobacteria bacterium]|nr:MAG: hypothetical protein EP335_05095 [Alphaproteobacteria bacterium]
MTRVCFVSNEIYPEHKGGIGRMLYNFAVRNAAADHPAELTLLMTWQPPKVQASIRTALDGLMQVAFCPLSLRDLLPWGEDYERSNPPQWHYGHACHQSLLFHGMLMRLEAAQGAPFDDIEFPDYNGWGMAALEAKAAGLAYGDTRLVVRLHSTGGIIAAHQPWYHTPGHWQAAHDDMERQCLAKADLVVGHVGAVVEANRQFYGFPDSWADRCRIEFPPIRLDDAEIAAARLADKPPVRDFIFSSRLQPFKQPDLFIKAAIGLLDARPDYQGRCRLISYGWDDDYITGLKALVPARFADRIVIETGVAPADRIKAIAGGIVVIPSNYESLCLFAFEASHLGATLVLNGACLAFADSSRWQAGGNCLTFDGTVPGLAATMATALDTAPMPPADISDSPGYWTGETKAPVGPAAPVAEALPLVVAAHGFADAASVQAFMAGTGASILAAGAKLQVMLPAALAGAVSATLPAGAGCVVVPGDQPWPEQFADMARAAAGSLLAFCKAETRIDPDYFTAARAAFAARPGLAAFGSHSRIRNRAGKPVGIRLYAGSAPEVALQCPDILPDAAIFRADMLAGLAAAGRAFDPAAHGHWQADLGRVLAFSGAEMVIAPAPMLEEVAPAVRLVGRPELDATLLERELAHTGRLPSFRGLAFRPLMRVAAPDSPRLDISQILKGAEQIWPPKSGDGWQPVAYRLEEKDLLVHPMPDTWVLADLPVGRGDIGCRVLLQMQHYGHDNPGVEGAIVAGAGTPDETLMADLYAGRLPAGTIIGDWQTVLPGGTVELSLEMPADFGFDWLAVATRAADGTTTSYAWTYVTRVWVA